MLSDETQDSVFFLVGDALPDDGNLEFLFLTGSDKLRLSFNCHNFMASLFQNRLAGGDEYLVCASAEHEGHGQSFQANRFSISSALR
jgi:hypothetical protein